MKTCKNCRFWREHVKTAYNSKVLNHWHECESYKDNLEDNGAEVYAEASDDSGLNYSLKTGPNFGCVNFETVIK